MLNFSIIIKKELKILNQIITTGSRLHITRLLGTTQKKWNNHLSPKHCTHVIGLLAKDNYNY